MKMVKMFGGVLIASTLVHAGGDFQVVTAYKSNDGVLAEEAYVESYLDEPVVIVEEEYVEQEYVVVSNKDREEDVYIEPTVDGYVDPVLIEEKAVYVSSSSNLGNAVNVYNASEHIRGMNSEGGLSQQSTNTKSGFYAGLGITALNYNVKCDCPDKSAKDTALGGMTKVGYNLNRFIGVEARGMKVNLKNGMGSVKHAGLFLKPMLPLGPVANAYSLVGVAQTKTSGKIRKVDTKSLALGAGMEFGSGKGVGAFVDYEKLLVKSGAPSFDTVSTGVSFGF